MIPFSSKCWSVKKERERMFYPWHHVPLRGMKLMSVDSVSFPKGPNVILGFYSGQHLHTHTIVKSIYRILIFRINLWTKHSRLSNNHI